MNKSTIALIIISGLLFLYFINGISYKNNTLTLSYSNNLNYFLTPIGILITLIVFGSLLMIGLMVHNDQPNTNSNGINRHNSFNAINNNHSNGIENMSYLYTVLAYLQMPIVYTMIISIVLLLVIFRLTFNVELSLLSYSFIIIIFYYINLIPLWYLSLLILTIPIEFMHKRIL